MIVFIRRLKAWLAVLVVCTATLSGAQSLPQTSGETLSGKNVVPADVVRGKASVLVAGFSREGGNQCGAWMKAIRADPALSHVTLLELAMLEKAPGMFRGVIVSGMRKGTAITDQDQIVVMTKDQKLWERFFGVENTRDPYVVVLDARGTVVWHGHGRSGDLEPLLKNAVRQ